MGQSAPQQELRLAEIVSALSYALDMTDGQPAGHSIRCCWIGMHVCAAVGMRVAELSDLFYTLLLKDLGCSSNAARICALFVTSDYEFKRNAKLVDNDSLAQVLRFVVSNTAVKSGLAERLRGFINVAMTGGRFDREIVKTRCERGADIARQLRVSDAVAQGILDLDEHWNGGGHPVGHKGQQISLLARIALLAQVVDVFAMTAGPAAALDEVVRRSGRWFAPALVAAFDGVAEDAEFWDAVRSHPGRGAEILSRMSAFAGLAKIALEHHERLDGKGYPQQLEGDAIDLETRIVTTADIFDALIVDRFFCKAMSAGAALEIMRAEVGTAIDGRCLAALERSLERLQQQAA